MIGIDGNFPGPILDVTTNWNVVVNVKNNLDEPLLLTWYRFAISIDTYTITYGDYNDELC